MRTSEGDIEFVCGVLVFIFYWYLASLLKKWVFVNLD